MLENEKLDLVAAAMNFIDAEGHPLPGKWTCPPEASKDFWGSLLERNWIGAPSVMVRRTILDAVGQFDEGFSHAEDYDLWLRIGRSYAIGYTDSVLIDCRRHAGNTSINIKAHQQFERLALRKTNPNEAWAAFSRLYAQAQRRAEAWIWFLLRRRDPAFREEVRLAIVQHPDSRMLRFAHGVFQYDCAEYQDALATFESLKESDASAMHNVGIIHAQYGDLLAAATHLQTALVRRPDYHDALYNLDALRNRREFRLTRRPFRENLIPVVSHGS
jgi:tetratricopeptide (TPR) repeat protein